MKEVKKHIQNEYVRNAFILSNRKDIHIADIPKLCSIMPKRINYMFTLRLMVLFVLVDFF